MPFFTSGKSQVIDVEPYGVVRSVAEPLEIPITEMATVKPDIYRPVSYTITESPSLITRGLGVGLMSIGALGIAGALGAGLYALTKKEEQTQD